MKIGTRQVLGGALTAALAAWGVLAAAPALAQSVPTAAVYVSLTGNDTSGTGSATAPFQSIAKALSAAAAGATIVLEPGTYKGQVTITKAVTLESDSSQANAAATTIIDATGQDHGILVQGAGAAGTVVDGLTVENANLHGILVEDTSKVTVENVVATNNVLANLPSGPASSGEYKAIQLQGASNSTVKESTSKGNKHGGIGITDDKDNAANGNTLSGNTVTSNGGDCGIVIAAYFPGKGVANNTVSGNTVSGNVAGIVVAADPPGTSATGNVIDGNTITKNFIPGIIIHSNAPGQTVSGNQVTNNTVSGNGPDQQVGLTQPTGIVVSGEVPPFPVTGTVITGNKISSEYYGIAQKNSQGSTVQGNTADASVTVATYTVPMAAAGGKPGTLPKTGASPVYEGTGLVLLLGGLSLLLRRRTRVTG